MSIRARLAVLRAASWVFACGLLGAPTLTACVARDCIDDVDVGHVLTLRIVEPYGPGSAFTWNPPVGSPLLPSCGDVGDLGAGTEVRLTVVRRLSTDGGCNTFAAVAADVPSVDAVDPGMNVIDALGALGTFHGACDAEWRLGARSHDGDSDVLGRSAIEGALPPVVVTRYLQGSCFPVGGCADFFVAELERE